MIHGILIVVGLVGIFFMVAGIEYLVQKAGR